jgi:hypothetical protein
MEDNSAVAFFGSLGMIADVRAVIRVPRTRESRGRCRMATWLSDSALAKPPRRARPQSGRRAGPLPAPSARARMIASSSHPANRKLPIARKTDYLPRILQSRNNRQGGAGWKSGPLRRCSHEEVSGGGAIAADGVVSKSGQEVFDFL